MNFGRFERQIRLFGENGQKKIQNTCVAIVGAGGIGSHVIQQLGFLGVSSLTIIDPDELEETNRNRLIGAYCDDLIPGMKKVDIAKRLINMIDASIKVEAVSKELRTEVAFSKIKESECVFGCVDNDGSRLILTELCSAFEIPYFDLASDIIEGKYGLSYGGRVFANFDENGCLCCYDIISLPDASIELESEEAKKDRDEIYGVSQEYLNTTGPSVVSIDGVVASLAVTEFVVMVTGLRSSNRLLYYHGPRGIVNASLDKPRSNCYYCKSIRGKYNSVNVGRYLKRNNHNFCNGLTLI
jgi:molybdopterin/thiamine biosynthesis adenylyltransferase